MPEPASAQPDEAGTVAFAEALFARVLAACYSTRPAEPDPPNILERPYDFDLDRATTARRRLKDAAIGALGRAGLARRRFALRRAARSLADTVGGIDGFARTYGRLADEESRRLLLDLLAARALGPTHVALPVGMRRFWSDCARIDRTMRAEGGELEDPHGIPLRRYELRGDGGPIALYGHPAQIATFYELEQYAYRRDGVTIAAEPGDTVVDGGGLYGETALYFADAVGAGGRVLCFEFVPGNLELLERNAELNERLRDRIQAVPKALWHVSGERLPYEPAGGVTTVAGGGATAAGAEAESESLDDFAERVSIRRVDFVKLDIEGAELNALRGAGAVLRRHRPKLAVSVYHRADDLVAIPDYLHDLGLGYEFRLAHFSPELNETILFCRAA